MIFDPAGVLRRVYERLASPRAPAARDISFRPSERMFRAALMQTANTSPASVRQRERTVYGAAPMTGLAGRKEMIHDREMPAAPDRLVFQLPSKLSEASIQHRFGQLGSRKALDTQVTAP
jgi:hypothetical protein